MNFFEIFLVLGGLLAYLTTYGVSEQLAEMSKQWRIPLSLQIIIAAFVLVGSIFLAESPRWLAKEGSPPDEDILAEIADMRGQLDRERAATEGREVMELFQKVGYTSQNAALLATGVITIIKVACTALFLVAGAQVLKRTHLFAIEGLSDGGPVVYIRRELFWNCIHRLMALLGRLLLRKWVFPIRMRDYGLSACVMVTWAMNFAVSKITPIAVQNIGWKTWIMFGIFNIADTDVLFGLVADTATKNTPHNTEGAIAEA
ncbi:general substrate transporter [Aspergillus terreus]|uniref:General substrate transporter n=1 Tax=Aspergillus terreus TaxID=33178 RepID=A0A5M3ZDQ2_ASPTE|nr:hypothetical protein ATETN484_0017002000 [Aspergillus terreus]GFF21699.1 general substrate transporter [Aspergillus terreus]